MKEYNQQIEPEAIRASAPEEIHPIAAAFGGDIGQALESGGQQVASRLETLNNHLIRMNYYRDEARRADIVNKYLEEQSKQVHGDPSDPSATVKYTPDANTKGLTLSYGGNEPSNVLRNPEERPLGVLNWQGNQAHGAMDYLDQWHHNAVDNAMAAAKGMGLRNNAVLISQLDKAWSSQRNSVAEHETKQIHEATVQTYMKGMDLLANSAVTNKDPISLANTIDGINYQNQTLNDFNFLNKNDPQKQIMLELTGNKFVENAVNNSINSTLNSPDGSLTQVNQTLDKLHDSGKISDTVYENAGNYAEKISQGIEARQQRNLKAQVIDNRIDVIKKITSKDYNLENLSTLANDVGVHDTSLSEAIKVTENKRKGWFSSGKYTPIDENNKAYSDIVNNIFKSKSQEEISEFLVSALHKGEISQDRLNIIVNAASRFQKTLPLEKKETSTYNYDPQQQAMKSGVDTLNKYQKQTGSNDGNLWTNFFKASENMSVPDSVSHAKSIHAVENNPSITAIPKEGQIRIDRHGNRAVVFPDGHIEAVKGGNGKQ